MQSRRKGQGLRHLGLAFDFGSIMWVRGGDGEVEEEGPSSAKSRMQGVYAVDVARA